MSLAIDLFTAHLCPYSAFMTEHLLTEHLQLTLLHQHPSV